MNISQSLMDEVVAHARDDLPNECCGILAGHGKVVERVFRAVNASPSPVYYEMAAQSQVEIFSTMEHEGMDLVGMYHSHPNGRPFPSLTDKRLSEYVHPYVIVGMRDPWNPQILAWRLSKDGSDLEELRVT